MPLSNNLEGSNGSSYKINNRSKTDGNRSYSPTYSR